VTPHPLTPSPNGAFEKTTDVLFGEGGLFRRGLCTTPPLAGDLPDP